MLDENDIVMQINWWNLRNSKFHFFQRFLISWNPFKFLFITLIFFIVPSSSHSDLSSDNLDSSVSQADLIHHPLIQSKKLTNSNEQSIIYGSTRVGYDHWIGLPAVLSRVGADSRNVISASGRCLSTCLHNKSTWFMSIGACPWKVFSEWLM